MSQRDIYQLLDVGDESKLEQIGPYRVTRQAAQAYWPKEKNGREWARPDGEHHRSSSGGGHWSYRNRTPESWVVGHGEYRFTIKLTDFGHIGLFPEQEENWRWIQDNSQGGPRVLNLFGYTGGSTLAAASGGAHVTHVDASKGAVAWARENFALNDCREAPVRWIVEDVQKYIAREERRGSKYQGLILDPPSFGRGPRGQVWKIEDDLVPLLRELAKLMDPLRYVLLSCHTPGYSPECLRNILDTVFDIPREEMEAGEMLVDVAESKRVLPSGTYVRWAVPVSPQ